MGVIVLAAGVTHITDRSSAALGAVLVRDRELNASCAMPCYTPDGSGEITEMRQYVFTEWAPTATSDMEALAAVFDTDGGNCNESRMLKMNSFSNLFLASVCLIFFSATTTSAETCLTNRGLAFAAEADLKPYRPCNRLGGTYLLGLGISDMRFSELPGVIPADLNYYSLVRAYLGSKSSYD